MRWLFPGPYLALILLSATAQQSAEPGLVSRPGAYKALVNPNCSHCRDEAKRRAKDLRDNDRVLCWIRGYSDGGAIPFRFFLVPYRVISDTYGVFVFDADAGFARGFEPSLDFDFHGWRNGVMVMKHKDGTLYSCLTGSAFAGPRKGTRLKTIPTLVSDWGPWLKRYPQAVAYHMFDKYQPVEMPSKTEADSLKSRGASDVRLPADTPILGVADGNNARAIPLKAFSKTKLLHDTIGSKKYVVLWYSPTRTAAAYLPLAKPPDKKKAEPRPLSLVASTDGTWQDEETGSTWDIAGRAVAGKLTGWTLSWLDSTQVRWFAWAAEYPKTTVYRNP